MFNSKDALLNWLYNFIDGIKGRLTGEELNEVTDIFNGLVVAEEETTDMYEQMELLESNEQDLAKHIQEVVNDVNGIFTDSKKSGNELFTDILETVNREIDFSPIGEYCPDIFVHQDIDKIIKIYNTKNSIFEIEKAASDSEVVASSYLNDIKVVSNEPTNEETSRVESIKGLKIEVGDLFMDKKNRQFVVGDIVDYKYAGETLQRIEYYSVDNSGLVDKSKNLKCKMSDFNSKFKLMGSPVSQVQDKDFQPEDSGCEKSSDSESHTIPSVGISSEIINNQVNEIQENEFVNQEKNNSLDEIVGNGIVSSGQDTTMDIENALLSVEVYRDD